MDASTTGEPDTRRVTKVERTLDLEVVVTRWFDAPPRLVFEAWSNPQHFQRWWIPVSMGMTLHGCEMAVRTGGTYQLDFGGSMVFFGRYLEVEPPSRIVWTNDEEHGSVTTVTFDDQDGGTLLVMTDRFPTKETLDAEGTGAAEATHETFAQLDDLLAASREAQPPA